MSSGLLYRTIPQTSALIASYEKANTSLSGRLCGGWRALGRQRCRAHILLGKVTEHVLLIPALALSLAPKGVIWPLVTKSPRISTNFYTNICILWLLDTRHVCRIISFNLAMEMLLPWLLQIRKWGHPVVSHWLTSLTRYQANLVSLAKVDDDGAAWTLGHLQLPQWFRHYMEKPSLFVTSIT